MNIDNLKKIDLTVVTIVILLLVIGLINIYSTTYFPDKTASGLFINQIIYVAVGIVLMFIIFILNYKKLNIILFQTLAFLFTLTLLIAVIFFGDEVLGAQRWISLVGFTIQPAEFAKITIILTTAFILSLNKPFKTNKFVKENFLVIKIAASFMVLFLTTSLVALQNSLGNTILISLIWGIMVLTTFKITESFVLSVTLFINGFILPFVFSSSLLFAIVLSVTLGLNAYYLRKQHKLKLFIIIPIILISLFLKPSVDVAYNHVLQDYQRQRIDTFINPNADPTASWNRSQAKIALGSGRVLGKGFLKGTHSNYRFLPFSFNDFAFAAIGEQFGLVGIIFLASLFGILLNRIVAIAKTTKDSFGRLVVFGVSALVFVNMFQHMGMNVGILPITGVPLPFISYGGSAILVMMIGIGLVLSVTAHSEKESNVTKAQLRVKR
ncbi:rod shape-determining protein RodA [Candidatus Dojkabacteria bacterium]|uniref:Rod shape-determining protein RodA n=1 Tax=Candidatus Dojkabacteria bacterium TaxID=2099670 RepID=A0A955LAY0_9BACT|nr:rod shape-determining protein RodA [Candidatus Dojkabacteria bacterium]